MSYNTDLHIDKWNNIQGKVKECLEAGFTLKEMFDFMGFKSREDWYKVKPRDFHWSRELRKYGFPDRKKKKKQKNPNVYKSLDELKEEKLKEEIEKQKRSKMTRERYAICKRFGVKNLKEIGCTSVDDYHRKLKNGVVLNKDRPLKNEVPEVRISGHILDKGKAMLVVCSVSEVGEVLRGIKASIAMKDV